MVQVNFPTFLTLTRLVVIPVMLFFFYLPISGHYLICALLFFYAAITDYIDGFLARKYRLVSSLGTFLDPVADKLLVIITLLMLVTHYNHVYFIIGVIIIVTREVLMCSLREWMALLGYRKLVKVSFLAKLKTGMQMTSIFLLLLALEHYSYVHDIFYCLGLLFLLFAVILTIASLVLYFKVAWPYLRYSEKI